MERRHKPWFAFRTVGLDNRLPNRRALGKFPRSQHRSSLIKPPRHKVPFHSHPVKCWNFRKADWKRFCLLTGESVERLPPAVNSINFSHSSRKAFTTINKLTGRSGRSSRLCPISANSISSQLVKNGEHRTGGRGTTRLVNKQLYDLWKIPTLEGHSISEPFRP